MDEKELIIRFQAGEERADKIVFDEFYQVLCYFTERLVKDAEEGQKIVIDAFEKLFHKRQNFDTLDNIKAFLYIACRNSSLNYLRDKQRYRKREKAFIALQNDRFFELEYLEAKVIERIHKAVHALPTQCRRVVELFYFEEKKYAEIADILGIAETTVRAQKRRGLQLLREKLGSSGYMLFTFLFYSGLLQYFSCPPLAGNNL